jgi:hypothetical protein
MENLRNQLVSLGCYQSAVSGAGSTNVGREAFDLEPQFWTTTQLKRPSIRSAMQRRDRRSGDPTNGS